MEGSGLDTHRFWLRYQRYPYLLAKLVTFTLVSVGLYFVLRAIEAVLFPVLLSLLLAYLLDPAVDWFEARGFSRTVGIALFLAIGGMFAVVFVLILYPTIAHIIDRITTGVPLLLALLENQTLPWLRAQFGTAVPDNLDILLDEALGQVQAQLPVVVRAVTSALGEAWTRTGAVAASLLNLVLIPVLTFYFLRDFDEMRLAAVDYLPRHNRARLLDRIQKMDEVVGAWFRGQIEVALVLSALYALGLGITFGVAGIGVTSGISIGVLAGLLNIIPYFGFLVGFVLSVLLALLDWSGWGPLAGVGITFAVVQALEGYVVTPRIVGEKVGLSPVVVIIALLLGGELLGLLGVLLALPIAGIVRVMLPDLIAMYRKTDLYLGDEADQPPPMEE